MQTNVTEATPARRPRPAPKPRGNSSGDWPANAWPQGEGFLYPQALSFVRRARVFRPRDIARALSGTEHSAQMMVRRMQHEGIIGAPDMFGEYRLVAKEGGHES